MTRRPEDVPFEIEVIGDETGLAESITKLVKERLSQRSEQQDFQKEAGACLENHLKCVDDAVVEPMMQTFLDIGSNHSTADVLMALAQTAVNIIAERSTPDEVREIIERTVFSPEDRQKALEQGLHEAECWNCFNRNVSIRMGAFGMLLQKLGAAATGMQKDAPDYVKAHMKKVTDEIEKRDPAAKHH